MHLLRTGVPDHRAGQGSPLAGEQGVDGQVNGGTPWGPGPGEATPDQRL